jgi:hypothetical protein
MESRSNRGWNVFTDVSGLPEIVAPGGFTTEVYDQLPGATGFAPPNYVREVNLNLRYLLPGAAVLEAGLPGIPSAFVFTTQHRHAPPDFTATVPGKP